MAAGGNRIQIGVGFNIDKSGLEQLQSLIQQIANRGKDPGQKINDGLRKAASTAEELNAILAKTFNSDLGTLNVMKFNQELAKSGMTMQSIQQDFAKAGSSGALAYNRLAQSILNTNFQLKESNKLLDSMATTMANTVRWSITSGIVNAITNSISKAVTYAKQLDSSLNDIRIVTDKSADSMASFAEDANKAAQSLGASTLEYTNASLIYYQQGLSDEEVKARAETTVKAANVTGQTGAAVSEQLTAVWNGYKATAEETELYVDKLAAVAATTAADLEELSVGMSRVAAAANAMGVDFDDLNAQIATIVSVTRQAPESVGTALKTIYGRLGDLQVDGVDEFGVSLGKVSGQLKSMGIDILDINGEMRDMTSVMAEVAEKWNTWTRAQQQAAAIAMAGKRQYNNLVALFENWDMYSEALETSKDALGTLQHQQDIYMESTEAKLKKLKATTQDLYHDLIKTDEINKGIEGLTNLVNVFDNFIESFGGGSKAVLAFGAIVSNIFNKQIIDGLNNTINRFDVVKQNAELLKTQFETVQMRSLQTNDPTVQASAAGLQEQIAIYERLKEVRLGLTQEQINDVIQHQEKIGKLEEEIQLSEVELEKKREIAGITDKENQSIKNYQVSIEDINNKYEQMTVELEKNTSLIEQAQRAMKLEVGNRQHTVEQLGQIEQLVEAIRDESSVTVSNGSQAFHNLEQIYKELINSTNATKTLKDNEKEINKTLSIILSQYKAETNEQEKRNNAAREYINILSKQRTNQDQQQMLKNEANAMLELGEKSHFTAQSITTVTSALGSMAMTWSSVSSLIDTINNKEISLDDKISRIAMTASFALPMLISSFSKLNEVFGVESSLLDVIKAKHAANIAIKTKNAIATQAEAAAQKVANFARKEEYDALIATLPKKYLDVVAEDQSAASYAAGSIVRRTRIELTQGEKAELIEVIKAKGLETAATNAQTEADIAETAAQNALNASMLACPIFWIVGALAVLAGSMVAITKYQDKVLENTISINNKTIERVNRIQEEISANNDLCNEYESLYNQYINNKIEKEELYDITDKICDAYGLEEGYLAKLTGQYNNLTKAIKDKKEAELDSAIEETQKKKGALENNLYNESQQETLDWTDKLAKTFGGKDWGYFAELDGGIDLADEKAVFEIIKKHIGYTGTLATGPFGSSINNAEDVINYYDQLVAAINEIDQAVENGSMTYDERNNSEYYINATKYIDSMSSTVEDYKETLKQLDNYQVQKIFNQQEFLQIKSLDDYNNKIKQIKNELLQLFDNDTTKVNNLLNTYLDGIDNEFVKISRGLDIFKKQLDDEAKKYIDEELTEGQKEYLLSGKVDLRFVHTKEDIQKEIQASFDHYGTFDVTTPVSLGATLASGNKLKKADNQAIQDMEAEEPGAMAGFDEKSTLHQLDVIDEVTQHRINKNHEYLQDFENVTQKTIALREEEKQHLEESQDFKNLEAAEQRRDLTEEETEKLENYRKKIDEIKEELIGLNDKLKEGLSIDEIEEIGFDNLTSGIDMVINRTDALHSAAQLIGEDFTVAASDVEKLANIFPELLEGYTALEDGSIQLDKDATKERLEAIKVEMEARTEAKVAEIDQQIALKQLEQEYLQKKLENLQAYLQGKQSEQATIDAINQAGFDYEAGLMQLTGQEITTLTNHAIASAGSEGQALVSMLNAVGAGFAQAANAHYAMTNGEPFTWTPINFNGTSGSAEEYASSIGGAAEALYTNYKTQYEDIYNQALEVQNQLNTVNGELDELAKKKAVLESTGKAAVHALDNVASGKAGKDSKSKGGGGGKDKKDKEEKDYEKEFDRYWEIKKAIDGVDHALNRLEKDKKNLYGYQLIDALKYENQLLEQQKGHYEQLLAAQEQEAAELRGQLGTMGVMFDASGAIINYAEATAKALAAYNAAIQQYNAGLIDATTLGVAKNAFKNFKEMLSRYDTLYYKEMQDTKDKLDDIRRKELENNLKAWEVELQVKLDLKELKRGWNDFLKEIQEDFQQVYQDLRVEAKRMMDDAKTYIGSDGSIMTIINAIHDVTHEIDVMRGGGESSMFESISQAQEKLKELNDMLQDAARGLHDLWKEAWENYLNGIDQVADKLEDLMDQFEKINDELEFQGELIELIYGEEAYELLDTLYKGQEKSLENQTISLKTQVDMWRELFEATGATMDNQENWTQDQREYYDRWMEAQADLNDLVLDYIKLLKNDYLNTIDAVLKELEHAVTGSTLDKVKTEWERISAYADKYLDDIEGAYEIQKLANKIDDSINNMNDLKYQQKLKAFRDEEIKYLREKEHLTQYDLDAAEARYQIMLKEMALEDAQNNKTSMKLVRNEQGNWAYQYVADEDDLANKRQELLDAFNDLYQLASDAYEANLESAQELEEKYLEKTREIAEIRLTDEELANEMQLELDTWYLEQKALLAEENQLYRNDLAEAGLAILLNVYEQDQEAFDYMTTAEQDMITNLKDHGISEYGELRDAIKNNYDDIKTKSFDVLAEIRIDWDSLSQRIMDLWNKDNGTSVKGAVTNAYNAITKANEEYKLKVDWMANAVERNFGPEGITGAINNAANATDRLREKTYQLVSDGVSYLAVLKQAVDMIAAAWQSVQQEIMNAIALLEEYISMIAGWNAAVDNYNAQVAAGQHAANAANGGPGGNGGNPNSTDKQYYTVVNKQTGKEMAKFDFTTEGYRKATDAMNSMNYGGANNAKAGNIYEIIDPRSKYATGGYTGVWGDADNGKLAVLHQKELVLNEDDTSNFLQGINTIRDLSSLNGSISNAIMGSIAGMVASIVNPKAKTGTGTINNSNTTQGDNVFNITAEFPNANDVNEIREAIMSLPNLASQYIARSI